MMTKRMEEMLRGVIMDVVKKCGEEYKFSYEEGMRMLGDIGVEKVVKCSRKAKNVVKREFPLPYNGEMCEDSCLALRLNKGLYTQCESKRMNEKMYCGSCCKLADKSGCDMPEYGTIKQRKEAYDEKREYTDPKGRSPTAYTKIMKKLNLTEERVLEEGAKLGMKIDMSHFIAPSETKRGRPAQPKEPKEPKGAKGRPKKEKKVIQITDDDEDIFATLVASVNVDTSSKNEEKEAKKAAEKAEKEAKKAAEKEEKEAKKAAEKAEKEAKKAAEKEAKKAAEKEAKKSSKNTAAKKEDEEEDRVMKKTYEGKAYLVSKNTGIVYDHDKYIDEENQEIIIVGKWNAEEKKVILNSSEESEDEYESDDE
jgi:hypothetical protein